MTPQSVGLVRAERRLVEEFYNCPLHVNAGLILAPFLSDRMSESLILMPFSYVTGSTSASIVNPRLVVVPRMKLRIRCRVRSG